jgi:hypothetical protein
MMTAQEFVVVGQFEMWHGRPAREITRKMRVPQQTDPLPNFSSAG